VFDHPLSIDDQSLWNLYFKDRETWEEINKDVFRTRSDMNFFNQPVDSSKRDELAGATLKQKLKSRFSYYGQDKEVETHSDVLSRILFVYAKLNKSIVYVQGMNELLAVIYYCFWEEDDSPDKVKYHESDTFWCFSKLMTEVRDGFMRTLDHEETGIKGQILTYALMLKKVDPELYDYMEQIGINHQFYSLRWLMLLLSQEFSMPNVIRLWDTLLSDHNRFNFVNYVCLAIVEAKREHILEGDFSDCLEALQRQ